MLGNVSKKMNLLQRNSDIILAFAVVGMVLLLIIPLPPIMLDVLLSISIVLAVTTLLITMYTEDTLEFNSFPSLLLFLTLFRLGLNIASTRMILSEAQAGDIIKTFGEFVSGGNLFVGLVIFILLTVINFVVITKGSGRVAEVAARFTLDAMPGKQMSIDADLNAGVIEESEARARREKITAEADFYGAMDGASKFVRGDAIAGIIINVVNVIGGLAIGIISNGMSWDEAVNTYMTLTIGDGLVSQVPALLISVGAGVIVTRSSSEENLGKTFHTQVFNNPKILSLTAFIIVILGFVPGMPLTVMGPIGISIAVYAYYLWKGQQEVLESFDPQQEAMPAPGPQEESEAVEKALFVDPMEIELGYGLIPLVDQSQGGDLLGRINVIRRQIASELGIVIPSIRIRDNMLLKSNQYVIKIKGIEVAQGELFLDSYLAMDPGNVEKPVSGVRTTEPAFGLPALWITTTQKEQAELAGYTVVDTLSVLATHLTEIIHAHAFELINRQEASRLVDTAKEYASAVIEELIPGQMTLGQVLKVLQNLLRERVSVRDFVTVLETLADHSIDSKDTDILTEYVRQGLSRAVTKQYSSEEAVLHAMTLDSRVEQMVMESLQSNEYGSRIVLRPATIQKIVDQVSTHLDSSLEEGLQLVLLTSPQIRMHFKRLIERSFPRLPVLSFNEISSDVTIESKGVVTSEVLM
jgi:flagellar biosynthesis protein FlhA